MYLWRTAGMAIIVILAIASVAVAEPITISAVDLRTAYQDDKREANRTYKGKQLVVFGYFDEVSVGIVDFMSGGILLDGKPGRKERHEDRRSRDLHRHGW